MDPGQQLHFKARFRLCSSTSVHCRQSMSFSLEVLQEEDRGCHSDVDVGNVNIMTTFNQTPFLYLHVLLQPSCSYCIFDFQLSLQHGASSTGLMSNFLSKDAREMQTLSGSPWSRHHPCQAISMQWMSNAQKQMATDFHYASCARDWW